MWANLAPSPTRWAWVWVDSGSWRLTGMPGVLRFMGFQSQTRLSDWTELTQAFIILSCFDFFFKVSFIFLTLLFYFDYQGNRQHMFAWSTNGTLKKIGNIWSATKSAAKELKGLPFWVCLNLITKTSLWIHIRTHTHTSNVPWIQSESKHCNQRLTLLL